VHFDGVVVGDYLADILVESLVLVELKALTALQAVHEVQTAIICKPLKLRLVS